MSYCKQKAISECQSSSTGRAKCHYTSEASISLCNIVFMFFKIIIDFIHNQDFLLLLTYASTYPQLKKQDLKLVIFMRIY